MCGKNDLAALDEHFTLRPCNFAVLVRLCSANTGTNDRTPKTTQAIFTKQLLRNRQNPAVVCACIFSNVEQFATAMCPPTYVLTPNQRTPQGDCDLQLSAPPDPTVRVLWHYFGVAHTARHPPAQLIPPLNKLVASWKSLTLECEYTTEGPDCAACIHWTAASPCAVM
jgi:hypothetical protein